MGIVYMSCASPGLLASTPANVVQVSTHPLLSGRTYSFRLALGATCCQIRQPPAVSRAVEKKRSRVLVIAPLHLAIMISVSTFSGD